MKHIMCVRLKQWPIDRIRRKRQSSPPEPAKDAASLLALGRWMIRFSPLVQVLPWSHAILLDVSGTQRLYGGFDRLTRRVSQSLLKLGISHRIAIAPTVGAAWALAYLGDGEGLIVENNRLLKHLLPLPVAALRLEEEALQALHSLGIATISQLTALPRHALPARLGPSILTRLDQATGKLPEPLDPIRPPAPIHARLDFDDPVDSLEIILEAFKWLVHEIQAELKKQGRGVRKLLAQFTPAGGEAIEKALLLAEPCRDGSVLFNLLRCAMETVKSDRGFIGVRLSVPVSQPLAEEQLSLLDEDLRQERREAEHLLERLRARLEEGAVLRAELVESHLPEKACVFSTALSIANPPPRSPSKARPLHLLPRPVEIGCMAACSSGGDAVPLSFNHEGKTLEIAAVRGPERIAPLWWDAGNKTRDYFDVEEAGGRRFWIFRVAETRKWYLHGIFDC